jgi:diguanylate cyclase (GGDEF)-like protein/PAS domain S-box-containing protein
VSERTDSLSGHGSSGFGGTRGVAGREEIESRLGDAESRYRRLLEQVPAVTYVDAADAASSTVYMSPQVEAMLGYAPVEWLADPELFVKLLHPEDRERVLSENEHTNQSGQPFRMEYRLIARDGRTVWVHDEAVLVRDEVGRPLYWQGIMIDITERKDLEGRLTHLAYHDPLTGLSNRSLFREQVGSALSRAERARKYLAVLYLDLDGLKQVNDSFGHEMGDRLLVGVARRLESSARFGEDAVARMGGDEFCVLLEDITGTDEALRVAHRVRRIFRQPFAIDDYRIPYVKVSIGIAIKAPGEGKTAEQLLREADAAMYRAKKKGKDRSELFESGMAFRILEDTAQLEENLQRAIEEAGFSLHYQPQLSFQTGKIIGWEALVRWEHPHGRKVAPTEFIPLAEHTGMIVPLGGWILKEACRQAKEWQVRYPDQLTSTMNVNFSARQFNHRALVEEVATVLEETGLNPSSLCMEITESVAMENAPSTVAVLGKLKELGVKLAIDDFGAGYSSLSYLKRFPVDTLKIDRSIIEGIEQDPGSAAIVSAAITLAHTFGLEAVAEGVETESEVAELRALGCDAGQGYYWWSPRPADAATALLEASVGSG